MLKHVCDHCAHGVRSNVRDRRAFYRQSLRVLEMAKEAQPDVITKTSLMLGLGEEDAELEQTMRGIESYCEGSGCAALDGVRGSEWPVSLMVRWIRNCLMVFPVL
jgi:hypothetical protein